MNKLCFFDCETTGLDPSQHEMIELGWIVVDGDFVEEFSVKVPITKPETADPEAFKVNGYTDEEWKDSRSMQYALTCLKETAKDAHFMAYNATFDWSFLQKALTEANMESPFHYHRFDLMTLAWYRLPDGHPLSLKKVCQFLGIPPEDDVHRALAGARCAYEVYKKLTQKV